MSQITADHGHGRAHAHEVEPHVLARREVDPASVTLPAGSTRLLSLGLAGAGAVCLLGLVVGAVATGEASHALSAYHTGFLYVLGLCLGCLGYVLIFQQTNAGWAAAVRRQAENVASLVWVPLLLFVPTWFLCVFVLEGGPFHWMSGHTDYLLEKKRAWLNVPFWTIRAVIYFGLWLLLGTTLLRYSRLQDETGDRWLTARARRMSAWGLLVFALTTAFASFDWLMSLDYHWFSTMFGVYYFAGSILSATALLAAVLCLLRLRGRLGKTFTVDHLHDLGKLLFAFTVFWAYITFCQYFLIWYSNIPEEANFYNVRKLGGWQAFSVVLIAAHFVVPFLLLLIRVIKRNFRTMLFMGVWVMVAHVLDLYYIVRPTLHGEFGRHAWLDLLGILGPVLLFLGAVAWKVASGPLIPIKDPRLHEVIEHKNYV